MKEVSEIFEQMLRTFEERSGFSMEHSSDLAVRLYAAAAELQSLYVYADWAMRQSFPQTADGEYLDRHAQLRAISRKNGTRAGGILRFRVEEAGTEDILIPAGTVCTTVGLIRFETVEDAAVKAGELTADVRARAENIGKAGNVSSGTVTVMTKAPIGIAGVTNPEPFQNGSDPESDAELRVRVLESFRRLPNGANAAFYEQRALSHEAVKAVSVLPRENGIGTVGVVIAGENGIPDEDVLDEVREDLNAVREIAVDVSVRAPEIRTVNVAVSVKPKQTADFAQAKTAIEHALGSFFTPALLGKNVYRVKLGEVIYNTGTVENYTLLAPAMDLAARPDVLPMLGSVSITEETE